MHRLTTVYVLGNDYLHAVTAQTQYTLRIDLGDFEGATRYAVYSSFAVADEDHKYILSLGAYSGTAGDYAKLVYSYACYIRSCRHASICVATHICVDTYNADAHARTYAETYSNLAIQFHIIETKQCFYGLGRKHVLLSTG